MLYLVKTLLLFVDISRDTKHKSWVNIPYISNHIVIRMLEVCPQWYHLFSNLLSLSDKRLLDSNMASEVPTLVDFEKSFRLSISGDIDLNTLGVTTDKPLYIQILI